MTFSLDQHSIPRRRRPVGGFFWDLTAPSAFGERVTIFVPCFQDGAKDLSARALALSSVSQRTLAESERMKFRCLMAAKAAR